MDLHAARTALDGAQHDLDGINTDLARLAETLPWLEDLADRVLSRAATMPTTLVI
ncbi:hypothetical protein [Enemella dayhoffiae]|uniref:hypothetical protein n=1 Tax=Enemella dayhoffiae TaxID=2016507 RepID=UPI0015960DC7|nr:hypothetical protein [Enemella dayhoffiae]